MGLVQFQLNKDHRNLTKFLVLLLV